MNLSYKERQIVLFPEATPVPDESKRPNFMAARLTLSIENLVILTVVSIMVLLFAFSTGVERGKRVALQGAGLSAPVQKETVSSGGDEFLTTRTSDKKTTATGVKTAVPLADEMKAKVDKAKNVFATKTVAAASSAPAAKPAGGYTIQVASYNSKKGAEIEASSLKKKGFRDVYIVPKGKHVILCVGNFKSRSEADIFGQKKLKSRYQDLRSRSL